MKKNDTHKTFFGIPEKRIPLYASAAAGMVLILTLLIVLPPLLRGEAAQPTGLRNPVQTDIADSGDSLRSQNGTYASSTLIPTDGPYTLSAAAAGEDSGTLYALPTDAVLHLTTTEPVTAETLQQTMTVTPEQPVVIEAADDGFLITPAAGSWSADTLYRLSFGDDGTPAYVCAFQTARVFAVDSVYPAHEMTEVPTDTGIEITFTDPVREADLA
ncbi:MAG: hypothetical protein IJ302_01415 [Clostridia bacterium]|nr:hypothetical protein [Clostridia bacterium]